MRRRAVLAAIGTSVAGLAGCQASGSDAERAEATRTPTTCESPDSRRITVDDTAGLSSDAAFSVTATMERERSDADGPARCQLAITNEGPERAITVDESAGCHPFNRGRGLSDPRGLHLYRRGEAPDERAGDCWTRDASPPDHHGFDGYSCGYRTLGSGETVATTYEVWDDHVTSGYMPAGTYRFRLDAGVSRPDSDAAGEGSKSGGPTASDDPAESLAWWLDLAVSVL